LAVRARGAKYNHRPIDFRGEDMKAAFYIGNTTMKTGPQTVVKPTYGEAQIKVAYCGICGTDLHIYHGKLDRRVHLPQVMGHEMCGTISALGPGVEGFSVGDRVTVMPLDPCSNCPACRAGHSHICQNLKFMGIDTPGAMQTYWTVPAHTLHHLPPALLFHLAALVEPVSVACHAVRLGGVAEGEYVVVLGGGPIGTLVALVAKSKGARVLVSEINPYRLQLLQELGLEAMDPRQKDLVEYVTEQTAGAGADVTFEVSGSAAGAELMTKLPRTRGRIVVVANFVDPPKVDLYRFFWRELRLFGSRVYEHQDFEAGIQMAASGSLPLRRLITETFPLEEVQAGLRQMEGGGAVMKVLIKCGEEAA
jgi:2-desacetyl-2-hydroxyethyl bacteriochlorophyllide A dehydrogenase